MDIFFLLILSKGEALGNHPAFLLKEIGPSLVKVSW